MGIILIPELIVLRLLIDLCLLGVDHSHVRVLLEIIHQLIRTALSLTFCNALRHIFGINLFLIGRDEENEFRSIRLVLVT